MREPIVRERHAVTVSGSRPRVPERVVPADEYMSWGLVTGLVRRRWLAFVMAVLLCLGLAAAYLTLTPPTYQASASILVEEAEYNVPEVVKRLSKEGDVNTQLGVLRSARLSEQVARDLALQLTVIEARHSAGLRALGDVGFDLTHALPRPVARSRVLTDAAVGDSADTARVLLTRVTDNRFSVENLTNGQRVDSVAIGDKVTLGDLTFTLKPDAAEFENILLGIGTLKGAVYQLQQDVKVVRPDRDADLIWIRYQNSDPEITGRVPDLMANHYIESRLAGARAKVQTAVQFLRGQADTLQRQLEGAEQALKNYREEEGIVSLQDEATSRVSQNADLTSTRTRIETERAALERLVAEADTGAVASGPSPFRKLTGFPTLFNNPVVSDLLHDLGQLENQRAELLLRRTAKDPDAEANQRRIAEVDATLKEVTLMYLKGLRNQVTSLDGAIREQSVVASRIPRKSMEEDRLSRKPRLLGDVYSMVETRLQEARIAESAADPGVTIVDRAGIPDEPVWPRKGLVLAVALAVGGLLGAALAWLREGMDPTVHSRADVMRAVGARVLGMVPHIKMVRGRRSTPILMDAGTSSTGRWRRRSQAREAFLIGGTDPTGAAVEAYAWLETSLALTRPADSLRTIAFTSPLAREGKTINAANLALSVARRGRRVLLIDADLRRGTIHHLFGIPREPGLADVLGDDVPLNEAVHRISLGGDHKVHVLPGGALEGHPSRLLRTDRMRELLQALTGHYDLVIIDSPPVNLVSDPLLLSELVDGVVLVARAGQTETAALAEAARHLREAGAPLLGTLLNDIDLRRDGSYDEAYRYLDQAGAYAAANS